MVILFWITLISNHWRDSTSSSENDYLNSCPFMVYNPKKYQKTSSSDQIPLPIVLESLPGGDISNVCLSYTHLGERVCTSMDFLSLCATWSPYTAKSRTRFCQYGSCRYEFYIPNMFPPKMHFSLSHNFTTVWFLFAMFIPRHVFHDLSKLLNTKSHTHPLKNRFCLKKHNYKKNHLPKSNPAIPLDPWDDCIFSCIYHINQPLRWLNIPHTFAKNNGIPALATRKVWLLPTSPRC